MAMSYVMWVCFDGSFFYMETNEGGGRGGGGSKKMKEKKKKKNSVSFWVCKDPQKKKNYSSRKWHKDDISNLHLASEYRQVDPRPTTTL